MASAMDPPLSGDINHGAIIKGIAWAEAGIVLCLLAARVYARARVVRSWGSDDWNIVIATVLAILNTICVSIAISHGMGRHSYYLTAEQRVAACKYIYLSYGFSIMSTCFGKISVALFLLRLVGGGGMERWFYAGIVSLLVVNITCTAFVYAQCTPARALWDIGIPHKCWDPLIQQRYSFFQGSFSAFSDLVLALYPVRMVWNLKMNIRIKVGLACILGLGVFAMIAAIIKTVELSALTAKSDYTFDTVMLNIWANTEQYLIIIAACIPTIRPLFRFAKNNQTTIIFASYTNKTAYIHQEESELRLQRRSTTTEIEGRASSGSTSEDDILPIQGSGTGIIKTTEVVLSDTLKKVHSNENFNFEFTGTKVTAGDNI